MKTLDINLIKNQFVKEAAAAQSAEDIQKLRVKYLGRKHGVLTEVFDKLKTASLDEKRQHGPGLNALRGIIESRLAELEDSAEKNEQIDPSLPGIPQAIGHLHPITQTIQELVDIFKRLGFDYAVGPEIETDWYNFTALNIPEDHPARDMWDTFYIKSNPAKNKTGKNKPNTKLLLRTHTSPVQIRYLEQHKPPCAVIVPGRVFRHEATDATHEHTFDQLDGLVVGKGITFGHLKWTIEKVLKEFFGPQVHIKFRPSFFPFVEPGLEVAMSHPHFKNGQWVEILGAGMVHQKVLEAAGVKANTFTGFAFGFGVTRFASMKYGVPDIRLFSENSLSLLRQF